MSRQGSTASIAGPASMAATASAPSSVQPPAKTLKRRKRVCSCRGEQVVAPGDRVAQRALPGGQVARSAGKERKALLEAGQKRRRRKQANTRRGQLDRQGQAVETTADLGHRGDVLCGQGKPGLRRLRPGDEERDRRNLAQGVLFERHALRGLRQRQGATGNSCSARMRSGSRLVASRDKRRAGSEHRRDCGRRFDDLFEVVQHEQDGLLRQIGSEHLEQRLTARFAHAERAGDGRHDERRVAQGREVDEEDAVGEARRATRRRPRARGGSCPSHPDRSG